MATLFAQAGRVTLNRPSVSTPYPQVSNPRKSAWWQTALKGVLAAALLVWMVRSGRLDVAQIAAGARQWPEMLGIAALLAGSLTLAGLRWHVLLVGQQLRLPFRQTMALTRIGLLFNTILPGAVSGDLVKGYYIAKEVGRDQVRAVTTIAVDRIVGMFSLMLVVSVGVLFNLRLVQSNPALLALSMIAAGGCVALAVGLAAAIWAGGTFVALSARLSERFPLLRFFKHAADALAAYRAERRCLWGAVMLSLPAHLLACASIYAALRAVGAADAVPPSLLLFLVPLGFVPMSLPIAPVGLGVGQAAFYAIFEKTVPGSGAAASSALTLYQAILLLLYLTGLWPYLRRRGAGTSDR